MTVGGVGGAAERMPFIDDDDDADEENNKLDESSGNNDSFVLGPSPTTIGCSMGGGGGVGPSGTRNVQRI